MISFLLILVGTSKYAFSHTALKIPTNSNYYFLLENYIELWKVIINCKIPLVFMKYLWSCINTKEYAIIFVAAVYIYKYTYIFRNINAYLYKDPFQYITYQ